MHRSALAAAVAAALLNPAAAFAADTPPTRPGNVSARLYPGAGGELFWSRSTDDRGVRGYEITRNGTSLGVRDATSFYDASLRAGTAYTFTVTAIDTAGQRSATATASFGGASAPARPAANNPLATVPDPAPSAAGAPAAPTGLVARVYSASDAELFWTRPSTPGLRYEVRRDGRAVTTTDGTSHFATGLSGGRDYAYQVIAIGRDGRRSAPASVTVRTTGSGAGSPGAAPPVARPSPSAPSQPAAGGSVASGLPAPANASLRVYSPTTAEIFWQRAAPSAGVVSTEVRRDGVVVQTSSGTSYYDANRVAGRAYRYELVAIGAGGRRSSTTVVGAASGTTAPTVPTAPSAGTLPPALGQRAATFFAVARGSELAKMSAIARWLKSPRGFGARFVSTRTVGDGSFRVDRYACPKGGTADVEVGPIDTAGTVGVSEVAAAACAVGPLTITGTFADGTVAGAFADGGDAAFSNVRDYRLLDSRDGSTVTMRVGDVRFTTGGSLGASRRADLWSAEGVSVSRPTGVSYAATRTSTGIDSASGPGLEFTADGLTGVAGAPARVQTTANLTRDLDYGPYTAGTIEVIAGNERYVYDADGGGGEVFQLTATANGATTAYTVPLSMTLSFGRLDTASISLGF